MAYIVHWEVSREMKRNDISDNINEADVASRRGTLARGANSFEEGCERSVIRGSARSGEPNNRLISSIEIRLSDMTLPLN